MPTYLEKKVLSEDVFFIDRVSIAARVVAEENLTAAANTWNAEETNKRVALARKILLEGTRGQNILALARLAAAVGTDGASSDWGDNVEIVTPWKGGRSYSSGDKVTSGETVYVANANHTSSLDFDSDSANWDASDEDVIQGIAGLEIEAVVRTIFPSIAGVSTADTLA